MSAYVCLFEGYVNFEVSLAIYLLKGIIPVKTFSLGPVRQDSYEGLKTVADMEIGDVDPDDIDLLILPGGIPANFVEHEGLQELMKDLYEREEPKFAAICAAPLAFAKAGILEGREYTTSLPVAEFPDFDLEGFRPVNVFRDDRVVTARACGYVDFALEIGNLMEIYTDEDDYLETVSFFREFKHLP